MDSKLVLIAISIALLGLVGQTNACGLPPPGQCCLLGCPLFSPCALTKPCPPAVPPPVPAVDPLAILQQVFDGIGALFKSIEALLPAGSPALGILENVFNGIGAIFGSVETTLGRRKRAIDDKASADQCDASVYKFGSNKHEGKLGFKSAKAANDGRAALSSLKEEPGQEIETLVKENEHKSAADRKKAFKKAKNGDAKDKLDTVTNAHTAALGDAKDATNKLVANFSPEAKDGGTKLVDIILDESLTPAEKETKIDELYGKMKPEVIKELGLKHIAFIKRAAHIASSPFATIGNKRVPVTVEF